MSRFAPLVVLTLLFIGGGWWYLGSSHTRLTDGPAQTSLALAFAPLPKVEHVIVVIDQLAARARGGVHKRARRRASEPA
jgi:hypothetical protein